MWIQPLCRPTTSDIASGQRIVHAGEPRRIADAAGEYHHAQRKHDQGNNAAHVAARDRGMRILDLLGRHRHALDREKEPDCERNGRQHAGKTRGHGIRQEIVERETGRHHGHEDDKLRHRQHRHAELKADRLFDPEHIDPHE
jgi:hypothetical protein